ncbi:MAG: hypothetical protein WBB86_01780 [Candidatus Omnitrophota bacterium]
MKNVLRDARGLTITELMVSAMVAAIIIATILSAWLFAYRTWIREEKRVHARVDLLKANETIKRDIEKSSATYMSFYPAGADTYTAISMPAAEANESGFYTLNEFDEIEWDKTIIYHVFTDGEGNKTLRRTVYDPRDNTMTRDERYTQLESVAASGTGDIGSTTDMVFCENLDSFGIKALPFIIDFYLNDTTTQRTGKVIFGWARIEPGEHTLRFEVTGKNENATNYRVGIDSLQMEPSGGYREAEYYYSSFAPSGAVTTSGETIVAGHAKRWGNKNYLRFRGIGVGDYIEFTDYYDVLRESSFAASTLNNVFLYDDESDVNGDRAMLELPEDRKAEVKASSWFAYTQTGYAQTAGTDGRLNLTVGSYPITLRTVIGNDYIDKEADGVRMRFVSSSANPLKIEGAYITRRNGVSGMDGLENLSATGRAIEEYHRHQQLFFKDVYDGNNNGDTDEILPEAWIPVDSEIWSEWTAFPLILKENGTSVEYFVTFCIPDLTASTWPIGWTFDAGANDLKYWQDFMGTSIHTYYVEYDDVGSDINILKRLAGTPDWTLAGYTVGNTDDFICYVAEVDAWSKHGTVESDIFDTGKENPTYNKIKWSEYNPERTEALLKARSSDDKYMDTAPDWDTVTGSVANPHSLSIGSGRYLQFLAELSAEPFWEAPARVLSYADYVDAQLSLSGWEFPKDNGDYLVTAMYSTWIDDVEIDWPKDDRICVISGYLARSDNYGQAKVSLDGRDLVRVLGVDMSVSREVQEQVITEKSSIEVEPSNTGK